MTSLVTFQYGTLAPRALAVALHCLHIPKQYYYLNDKSAISYLQETETNEFGTSPQSDSVGTPCMHAALQ